jgi:hypothetical protein
MLYFYLYIHNTNHEPSVLWELSMKSAPLLIQFSTSSLRCSGLSFLDSARHWIDDDVNSTYLLNELNTEGVYLILDKKEVYELKINSLSHLTGTRPLRVQMALQDWYAEFEHMLEYTKFPCILNIPIMYDTEVNLKFWSRVLFLSQFVLGCCNNFLNLSQLWVCIRTVGVRATLIYWASTNPTWAGYIIWYQSWALV